MKNVGNGICALSFLLSIHGLPDYWATAVAKYSILYVNIVHCKFLLRLEPERHIIFQ